MDGKKVIVLLILVAFIVPVSGCLGGTAPEDEPVDGLLTVTVPIPEQLLPQEPGPLSVLDSLSLTAVDFVLTKGDEQQTVSEPITGSDTYVQASFSHLTPGPWSVTVIAQGKADFDEDPKPIAEGNDLVTIVEAALTQATIHLNLLPGELAVHLTVPPAFSGAQSAKITLKDVSQHDDDPTEIVEVSASLDTVTASFTGLAARTWQVAISLFSGPDATDQELAKLHELIAVLPGRSNEAHISFDDFANLEITMLWEEEDLWSSVMDSILLSHVEFKASQADKQRVRSVSLDDMPSIIDAEFPMITMGSWDIEVTVFGTALGEFFPQPVAFEERNLVIDSVGTTYETVLVTPLPGNLTVTIQAPHEPAGIQSGSATWNMEDFAQLETTFSISNGEQKSIQWEGIPAGTGVLTVELLDVAGDPLAEDIHDAKILPGRDTTLTVGFLGSLQVDIQWSLPPDKPAQLDAVYFHAGTVKLSWPSVSGATGYRLYRAISNPQQQMLLVEAVITQTQYEDTDLTLGERHFYWVEAINAHGLTSGPSKEAVVHVPGTRGSVLSVRTGNTHSLAVKSDGTVWAWGNNGLAGRLGDGTIIDRLTPVVPAGGTLPAITATLGGTSHTVALSAEGTIWTWGNNLSGQLGNATYETSLWPVQVLRFGSPFSDVAAVGAGGYHTIALRHDGTVWAWGLNSHGQLGDNTTVDKRPLPVQVRGPGGSGHLTDIVAIAAGSSHNLALKDDGTIWAWGSNSSGQLGDGTTTRSRTPVQVTTANETALTDIIAVATGNTHSLAIKADGTVWAWGSNQSGQIGADTTESRVTRAVQVKLADGAGFLSGITAICAGGHHSIALRFDGTVWAWGSSTATGFGTTHTAAQVLGEGGQGFLENIWTIGSGGLHSLAVAEDGTVWAWGANSSGQLGDGTTHMRSAPVRVTWD